jgi:hypothetical protein
MIKRKKKAKERERGRKRVSERERERDTESEVKGGWGGLIFVVPKRSNRNELASYNRYKTLIVEEIFSTSRLWRHYTSSHID